MIAGVIAPDAGSIEYGVRTSLTYYAQHQLEELDSGNTVFEELDRVAPGWSISQVRTLWARSCSPATTSEARERAVGREKSRLALAKMLVAPRPCCAWTSPPTTSTSPAPTSWSRRCSSSRAPSCSSRTTVISSAVWRTASLR